MPEFQKPDKSSSGRVYQAWAADCGKNIEPGMRILAVTDTVANANLSRRFRYQVNLGEALFERPTSGLKDDCVTVSV